MNELSGGILEVSQLNNYIKELMDLDPLLRSVAVRGELSNFKTYPSGHSYFSLKDSEASLRCVMFRSSGVRLRFRPENGMSVTVSGRVSVFPRDGQYQLYCTSMAPDGAGDLSIAFEQLKRKLAGEGLFDESRKKPIPRYPNRICIITSPVGAAIRDMLRVLGARWPAASVLLLPVRVQGEEAPGEIAAALGLANSLELGDLIITGRGGGSAEDLWAFNDEGVARAIAASDIPVISAVGHEPDVTISDYVADLRAATPSNAAELAVPDSAELRERLESLHARLERAALSGIAARRARLEALSRSRVLRDPLAYIQDKRVLLDFLRRRLHSGASARISEKNRELVRLSAKLDALSPLKVLTRGYAIASRADDGSVIKSVADAEPGDSIELKLSDGGLRCTVDEKTGGSDNAKENREL